MRNSLEDFDALGRLWRRSILKPSDLSLLEEVSNTNAGNSTRLTPSDKASLVLGRTGPIAKVIFGILPSAFPTSVLSFYKSLDANWGVPWHQDRVISVANQTESGAYTNWSNKTAEWHCKPPLDVLKNTLFLRIHLDTDENSSRALEIALGSHRKGWVLHQKQKLSPSLSRSKHVLVRVTMCLS